MEQHLCGPTREFSAVKMSCADIRCPDIACNLLPAIFLCQRHHVQRRMIYSAASILVLCWDCSW